MKSKTNQSHHGHLESTRKKSCSHRQLFLKGLMVGGLLSVIGLLVPFAFIIRFMNEPEDGPGRWLIILGSTILYTLVIRILMKRRNLTSQFSRGIDFALLVSCVLAASVALVCFPH